MIAKKPQVSTLNEMPHAANVSLLEAPLDSRVIPARLNGENDNTTERPLKIMMLYQDFGVMGGIERYLLQTAKLLSDDPAYEVVVACSADGPLFQQLQALGVTVHGLPSRAVFAKSFLRTLDVFSLFRIAQLLNREKPDLVHVHIGLQENLLWKKLGFPVVYTFHGYDTLFSMAGVNNPIKRAFKSLTRNWFQQTARQMDALLVVSEMERQRLRAEGYLAEDITSQVLHNGMDIKKWQAKVRAANREDLRRHWQIPAEATCVAYFNRMDPSKCPLDFVALAQTLSRHAQAAGRPLPYFLMAGDGPLENEVRAASAGLENFRMLGRCEDIPGLLASVDLVVHPAAREGFGLGVVETMAAGVPILAYHCGGPAEILGVPELSRLLVPVNDVDALAQQANALLSLSPADREALGQALQRRASDFSVENFKANLTRVYRQIRPNVSVILPVFNGEDTILRAVRSVLNQLHTNLELIVVDDGSTDRTLDLLSTVRDSRLKVLSQTNSGVAVARNFAFANASGEWIAFIDADDVWLPEKLATELQTR